MSRTVVLLCGPAGAGKTTAAHEGARRYDLRPYDRDDPHWTSERHFTEALARLKRNPDAHAVVIRSCATSSARAKTAALVGATHTYLLTSTPDELGHRVAHRNRGDVRNGLASIKAWFADHDRRDEVPDFPGWEAVLARSSTHKGARARLRAEAQAKNLPCILCGQPIDYSAVWPHVDSFSLEHIKPVARFPGLEHDPRNHAPAHWGCNASKQDDDAKPTIGSTSRQW